MAVLSSRSDLSFTFFVVYCLCFYCLLSFVFLLYTVVFNCFVIHHLISGGFSYILGITEQTDLSSQLFPVSWRIQATFRNEDLGPLVGI